MTEAYIYDAVRTPRAGPGPCARGVSVLSGSAAVIPARDRNTV